MSQRERFEAWAKDEGYVLTKHSSHGGYYFSETANAWRGWQAACPEGWQAVPKLATQEIENSIAKARNLKACEAWEDALAAAPKPEDV
ncbi:hypothetical protein [Halomonas sp. hl-4]|uniref:hypothetical protein n=1 Tax=Halomonas sp. hl-4 TaxID=1761789 RepID=UPI000BB75621|nr:hypothetical protein [Halomonas sp. hl-4]SNY95515.1 hypothetical protein SAMN04488142_0015 [Halomonas sp. hl-4]